MTNFLMSPHNLNEALRLRQKGFEGFNDIKPVFSTRPQLHLSPLK